MASLKTLQDVLYEDIRRPIVDMKLKPGERIKIEGLAHKLGVSRTPIREVLQRLSTEGLVRIIPRVGPVVAEMSIQEVKDLVPIRISLEILAVKQGLERFRSRDIAALERILDKARNAVEKGDAKKVRNLNVAFHRTIFGACGNEPLQTYLEDVFTKLQRYNNILASEDAIRISATRHHERIVESIKNRSLVDVQKAVEEHLIFSQEAMLRLLGEKYAKWLKGQGNV